MSRFAAGPRVTPSDYEKFFFKCHDCQLGFKRRGMLINHMAKRHPEIPLNSIRELNEPIMRSQRDFYCQYCDKVYKSSSKRKAHITKSHPGAELPAGAKRRGGSLGPDDSSLPNPTYSATVGNVLSSPHGCEFCHKQYSTKAKLLQHRRSKHPAEAERGDSALIQLQTTKVIVDAGGNSAASKVLMISRHVNGAEIQFIPQNAAGVSSAVAAGELTDPDILTQAMTELTQFGVIAAPSLGASEYHTIVPCVVNMPPGTALVQSLTGVDHEPAYATTIIQHGQQAETDPTVVSSSAYHQGQNMNWNVLTGGSSFQAF